jgi:hypothetical protein
MFTGQLPWGGHKQLGVEQLHSSEQLPDPRELFPELPPLLSNVLRRVTAANPEQRPRSVEEVMKMVAYVFGTQVDALQRDAAYDEQVARDRDAGQLLREGLARWEAANGNFNLGLTQFALIDLQREKHAVDDSTGGPPSGIRGTGLRWPPCCSEKKMKSLRRASSNI